MRGRIYWGTTGRGWCLPTPSTYPSYLCILSSKTPFWCKSHAKLWWELFHLQWVMQSYLCKTQHEYRLSFSLASQIYICVSATKMLEDSDCTMTWYFHKLCFSSHNVQWYLHYTLPPHLPFITGSILRLMKIKWRIL